MKKRQFILEITDKKDLSIYQRIRLHLAVSFLIMSSFLFPILTYIKAFSDGLNPFNSLALVLITLMFINTLSFLRLQK